MAEEYTITYLDEPAWDVIGPGITQYNTEHAGSDRAQWLCFVLRAPDGEILGGVIGAVFYEWLHVDLMWLKEAQRGLGYGRRLMALAEEEGRKRGAKNAFLDTFDFQAPGFYKSSVTRSSVRCPTFHPGTRATT